MDSSVLVECEVVDTLFGFPFPNGLHRNDAFFGFRVRIQNHLWDGRSVVLGSLSPSWAGGGAFRCGYFARVLRS